MTELRATETFESKRLERLKSVVIVMTNTSTSNYNVCITAFTLFLFSYLYFIRWLGSSRFVVISL